MYSKHDGLNISPSKFKLQNGNAVSINTTPDYNYYRILNPQKKKYRNDISEQVKTIRRTNDYNSKIQKEEDVRASFNYERMMRKFEKAQCINREKVKKALRDDITWQIKEKLSRSARR